jgi:hypothetical protein
MVQGRAVEPCFEFGTGGASLVNCGFVVPDSSSEGGFNLNILGGALPSATGVYFFDGEGTFLSKGDLTFVILNGNLTFPILHRRMNRPAQLCLALPLRLRL